jgi:HEAT repeat protein
MKRFLGVVGIVLCATMARSAEVGDLIKKLKEGDNDARRAAAKALAEGGAESKSAVPALIFALRRDKDLFVRRFSAQALGDIGPDAKSAIPALTAALNDSKQEVQIAAAGALGKLGPSGIEALIGILKDDSKDPTTRRQAVDSLSHAGDGAHAAVPVLTALVKGTAGKNKKKMAPEDLRVDAANVLGSLAKPSDKEAISALEALGDKKSKAPRGLKQAANMALRKIKNNQ